MQVAHTYRKFGNGQFDNYSSNVYNIGMARASNRYPILPGNTVNHINISDACGRRRLFPYPNVTPGYDIKTSMEKLQIPAAACMSRPKPLYQVIKEWIQSAEPLNDKERVTGVDVGNYPKREPIW